MIKFIPVLRLIIFSTVISIFVAYMVWTYSPRIEERVVGDFRLSVGDSVEHAWQIHSPTVGGFWETLEEPEINDQVIKFQWTHPNGDVIDIWVPTAMSFVYKQPYR